MSSRRTMHWLAWTFGGATVGGVIGIGIAWGAGLYAKWANPTDLSAGSIGIMVIATFPLGLLVGFFAGIFAANAWVKKPSTPPRGFDVVRYARSARRAVPPASSKGDSGGEPGAE